MPDNFANRKSNSKLSPRTKAIIVYSIIGVFAVGLGVTVGIFGDKFFKKVGSSSIVVDASSLADNQEAVLAKYDSVKKKNSFHTDLTPNEIIGVAMYKFTSSPYYFSIGVGSGDAGITTQGIKAMFIKNQNKYFEESISTGLINLYDRMYEEGDKTTTYWGGSTNYAGHTPKEYTLEEYKQLMGRNVSTPSSYVISSKTCLYKNNLSGKGVTSATKTSTGYQVEIELNPNDDKGVSTYRVQMKTISGLYSLPSFYFCHLSFKLDKDLNFIESTAYERYFAEQTAVVGATVTTTINTKYFTYSSEEGAQKIPGLDEIIDYSKYF